MPDIGDFLFFYNDCDDRRQPLFILQRRAPLRFPQGFHVACVAGVQRGGGKLNASAKRDRWALVRRAQRASCSHSTSPLPPLCTPATQARFQGTREHGHFLGTCEQKENKTVNTGTKAYFREHGTWNTKIEEILLGNTGTQLQFCWEQGKKDPVPLPREALTPGYFRRSTRSGWRIKFICQQSCRNDL